MMTDFNTVIGTRELSAWQITYGIVWVQSRDAFHTRRLSQRSDSRLVVRGVAGGYLKTFEFPHSLAWARRLIARYTRNEKPTNQGNAAQLRAATASETSAKGGDAPLVDLDKMPTNEAFLPKHDRTSADERSAQDFVPQ